MADDQFLSDDPLLAMVRDARPVPDETLPGHLPYAAMSPQAQALFERITAVPPGTTPGSAPARRALRRPTRPMRQIRRLPFAIAGAATAAAIIVAGTLFALSGNGAGPGGGLRPGSVVSSAYLLAKMAAAPQASSDITYASVADGGGYSQEVWRLGNGRATREVYRSDGRTCYDIAQTATQVTVVDYINYTWWIQSAPKDGTLTPDFSDCRLTGFIQEPASGNLASLGTSMRGLISQGNYTVDGTTVINGEPALSLTAITPSGVSMHDWISTSTYLLLRESLSVPAHDVHMQANISYVRPTKANLDQLTVPIPPGFTHRQQAVAVTPSGS
jgi:hypothetical protein